MLMLKQSIKSLSLEDYSVSKRKKKKEKEKGVCVNKKKKNTYRNHATTKKTPRILLTTSILLCSEHSVSGVGHVIYFSIPFKDKGLLHAFFFKGRKKQKG